MEVGAKQVQQGLVICRLKDHRPLSYMGLYWHQNYLRYAVYLYQKNLKLHIHFLILCLTDVKEFCNIWFFSWALKGPHIANTVKRFHISKNSDRLQALLNNSNYTGFLESKNRAYQGFTVLEKEKYFKIVLPSVYMPNTPHSSPLNR